MEELNARCCPQCNVNEGATHAAACFARFQIELLGARPKLVDVITSEMADRIAALFHSWDAHFREAAAHIRRDIIVRARMRMVLGYVDQVLARARQRAADEQPATETARAYA